jgi:hypothetical protein
MKWVAIALFVLIFHLFSYVRILYDSGCGGLHIFLRWWGCVIFLARLCFDGRQECAELRE